MKIDIETIETIEKKGHQLETTQRNVIVSQYVEDDDDDESYEWEPEAR